MPSNRNETQIKVVTGKPFNVNSVPMYVSLFNEDNEPLSFGDLSDLSSTVEPLDSKADLPTVVAKVNEIISKLS